MGPQKRDIGKLNIFAGGRGGFGIISVLTGFWEAAAVCAHKSLGHFRAFIPGSGCCRLALGRICTCYQIPPSLRCRILCGNAEKTAWSFPQVIPCWGDRGWNPSPEVFWECALRHGVGKPGNGDAWATPLPLPARPLSRDTKSLIHTMALLSFQTISSNSAFNVKPLFSPCQKQRRSWRGVRGVQDSEQTQHTQPGDSLKSECPGLSPDRLTLWPCGLHPKSHHHGNDQGTHHTPHFVESAQSLEWLNNNREQLEILF